MGVIFIHAGAFILVLTSLAFIAGGMSRLKKHNVIQDEAIANIKTAYSNDITSIRKDLTEVEEDIKAISEGQTRMYSDFKGALKEELSRVIDSNNKQSERLDRVLELLAQQNAKK